MQYNWWMGASKFILPLVKKTEVASDTLAFFFDRTAASQFDFLPGQYVQMRLPHDNPDEKGTARFFTISSSPLDQNYLVITTRVRNSSFKQLFARLEIGQLVQFFGPLGSLVLDETETQPRIYLSGGMGITPFHSMLLYSAQKGVSIPQTLFASFSTREEMVFYDELSRLSEKKPNLKAIYTISRPENVPLTPTLSLQGEGGSRWNGETGRITKQLLEKYVSLVGNEIYYLCGPTSMVDAMREMVQGLGVSEEQIRIEYYSGY